jgi:Tfp pilus assembly protein PilF
MNEEIVNKLEDILSETKKFSSEEGLEIINEFITDHNSILEMKIDLIKIYYEKEDFKSATAEILKALEITKKLIDYKGII